MITPTVGRIVWWGRTKNTSDEPKAALITKVNEDGTVNLATFEEDGTLHPRQCVPLVEHCPEPHECEFFCQWMPYQKQKAASADNNSESAEPRPPLPPLDNPSVPVQNGSQHALQDVRV